jgi:hypothetical protein
VKEYNISKTIWAGTFIGGGMGTVDQLINSIEYPASASKVKLNFFEWTIYCDAAGRAALALVGDAVRCALRFLAPTAFLQIGVFEFAVTASPGNDVTFVAGTHDVGIGAAASIRPAPDLQRLIFPWPIELMSFQGFQLILDTALTSGGVFPANTTISLWCSYSYYL